VANNRLQALDLDQRSGVDATTMISVLSGKGGVGKSIIAFNLAERLAAAGQRTLLVDADVACGNIHILANKTCTSGFSEFAAQKVTLVDAVVPGNAKLAILGMSPQATGEGVLTVTSAAAVAANLRKQGSVFDFMVLDHASGVSESTTVLAAASDVNLLVVVPELTSISDTYGLSKYLHSRYRELDCRLLVNRSESDEESEFIRIRFSAVVEKFLGWNPQFIGTLPEDRAVRQALAAQKPLAAVAPEAPMTQALTRLAQQLIAEYRPVSTSRTIHVVNNNPALADIRG
jgi:flagellar biosynthesis protein FlhG